MEESMGITAEPLQTGSGGKWMRAAKAFTIAGGIGAMVSRRRRWLSVLSGVSLLAGSFCTRMAVFQGGLASAKIGRASCRERGGGRGGADDGARERMCSRA